MDANTLTMKGVSPTVIYFCDRTNATGQFSARRQ
jgi:hypothetical protein